MSTVPRTPKKRPPTALPASVAAAGADTTSPDVLSADECDRLARHEATIEAGCDTFVQVGAALMAVRDERLYRQSHKTFEAYLADRWSMSRPRAYQLIEATSVAKNLSTTVDTQQLTERQVRELAPLGPEEQRMVYRLAAGTASEGKVTSSHLRSLVTVAREVIDLGVIDDGTGQHVPWDALSQERKAALMQAAVTEETYERFERQRERIRHALTSSTSVEWYTPSPYVEAAREVLGAIDLDPASCGQANATVRANRYFTVDNDGLTHTWPGCVFLNPPYGGQGSAFVRHLLDQYAKGITTAAIHVQHLLGHQSLEQTTTYLNVSISGLEESMRQYDALHADDQRATGDSVANELQTNPL